MVKGKDLHVNRVNLEKGEIDLSGNIESISYSDIQSPGKQAENMIHHTHWIIELEDLAYWVGTAIFLFVQIYYTSSGSVRGYFVLGIGLGASAMSVFLVAVRKWYRKIVCPGSGFLDETLEKGRKKR